jgi:hypothetical protein
MSVTCRVHEHQMTERLSFDDKLLAVLLVNQTALNLYDLKTTLNDTNPDVCLPDYERPREYGLVLINPG